MYIYINLNTGGKAMSTKNKLNILKQIFYNLDEEDKTEFMNSLNLSPHNANSVLPSKEVYALTAALHTSSKMEPNSDVSVICVENVTNHLYKIQVQYSFAHIRESTSGRSMSSA